MIEQYTNLFKNYLIPLNYSIIFYMENNYYFFYSTSSIRKYKYISYYNLQMNVNEIIINNSLFHYNKIKNYFFKKTIYNNNYKFIKYIKEVFYENKSKLKIVGRGWKINKYNYQLLIKLGYSHMIYINLSPLLKNKIKKKKKKYYLFYGVFFNNLNNNLNKIKLMRIPNLYTKKGIFHHRILL